MTELKRILGFESSCDETGVALVEVNGDAPPKMLAQALYSQITMHQAYGGVVPELASRDHVRRVLPLTREVLSQAGLALQDVDLIAYTQGPGLAGALLARGVPQAEVAARVGLYDQSQLHRHFKRIAGVTPGAYARAAR